jgi:uncharacterized membrane protein
MTRYYWWFAVALVVAVWAVSAWLYPTLPARIPTHWGIDGKVDGYGDKGWAVFLMPLFLVGMLIFFRFLPALSPKNFEVEAFHSTYLLIMVLILGLFSFIHAMALYGALHPGWEGSSRTLIAGMFLFFAPLGNVLGKVRRNFYIGVRTPWTLASERVWTDTHRLAAWLLVLGSVVGFVITVAGLPLVAAIAVLMASLLVPVVYSFARYKSLERRGAL